MFQRVQRTVCLGVSGPRANGFGELLPSWGRRSACALAALCALAGCESQKDQCPQPDEYWCNGNVIETCHEDTNRYTINYVYDCALIDAQCEEHDGEVDCVFAELSCAGRPAQSCEDNRKVFCPDGWSSPIPGTDCDSIRSFCVETYLGTADCSAVPESCSPETPQAKCYEGRRFVCSEGFWRRATSSEGTMCTEFMAEP